MYFDELMELMHTKSESGPVLDYLKIQIGFKGQRYEVSLSPLPDQGEGQIKGQIIFDNKPVEEPNIDVIGFGTNIYSRSVSGPPRVALAASGGQLRVQWFSSESTDEG